MYRGSNLNLKLDPGLTLAHFEYVSTIFHLPHLTFSRDFSQTSRCEVWWLMSTAFFKKPGVLTAPGRPSESYRKIGTGECLRMFEGLWSNPFKLMWRLNLEVDDRSKIYTVTIQSIWILFVHPNMGHLNFLWIFLWQGPQQPFTSLETDLDLMAAGLVFLREKTPPPRIA